MSSRRADSTDAGKASLNDLLVEAWASALEARPAANAVGREIDSVFSQVDVSVAVALENGWSRRDSRCEHQVRQRDCAEIKDLALRARARKLKQTNCEAESAPYPISACTGSANSPQSSPTSTSSPVGAQQYRADRSIRRDMQVSVLLR